MDLGCPLFVCFSNLREFNLQLITFNDMFLTYYHYYNYLIKKLTKEYMYIDVTKQSGYQFFHGVL